MIKSYDQLNTEFLETKKASLFVKLISVLLALTFTSTSLVEIIPSFEYIHNIYDYYTYDCFGIHFFPYL
ncbi:hypothetical protein CXF68_17810 [Tenacibaculum sp. Bg11-29]|nr:hypothetical protein CXF68_17810 [Tenacibaculum sp. Bg11-29]